VLEVVATPDRALAEASDVAGTVCVRRGGSAANACVAFAALGGRSVFIGAVGRDTGGRRAVDALRAAGVEPRLVRVDAPTARLLALVAPDGERSFVTQRGAADRLRAGDIQPRWLRGTGVLHVPGYSLYNQPLGAAAARAVELARDQGSLVSIDLSSRAPLLDFGRDRARTLIAGLRPDVLFANASEAAALFPRSRPTRLLEVAAVAVVKEGRGGARVIWRGTHGEQEVAVATSPINAVDSTGAGDAFAAGFLHSVLSDRAAGSAAGSAVGTMAEEAPPPWSAPLLRRAVLAGHRSAAALLRSARPEIAL
jgi:sugar/nucleoside kinase (ribokinase family)